MSVFSGELKLIGNGSVLNGVKHIISAVEIGDNVIENVQWGNYIDTYMRKSVGKTVDVSCVRGNVIYAMKIDGKLYTSNSENPSGTRFQSIALMILFVILFCTIFFAPFAGKFIGNMYRNLAEESEFSEDMEILTDGKHSLSSMGGDELGSAVLICFTVLVLFLGYKFISGINKENNIRTTRGDFIDDVLSGKIKKIVSNDSSIHSTRMTISAENCKPRYANEINGKEQFIWAGGFLCNIDMGNNQSRERLYKVYRSEKPAPYAFGIEHHHCDWKFYNEWYFCLQSEISQ